MGPRWFLTLLITGVTVAVLIVASPTEFWVWTGPLWGSVIGIGAGLGCVVLAFFADSRDPAYHDY